MEGPRRLLWCIVLHCVVSLCSGTFKFASYYSDHMVLQKGPRGAVVWGTSTKLGDTVHISLNGKEVSHGVVTQDPYGGMMWMVKVTVTTHNYGPYTLQARSSLGTITLHDVLFGDVWVCSGQSNMEYRMSWLENATEEYADASSYNNVRIFRANHDQSNSSLEDFHKLPMKWDIPRQTALQTFSAVCWLFGKRLSSQFQYPIGLMESNFGGTRIEWWSSQDALNKCPHARRAPIHNSELWNAMMNPLTRNTIYGVIWYQGESNSFEASKYACMFPTMINDWRQKFSTASMNTTSRAFPFGFVQLAPNKNLTLIGGVPQLRWSQTAEYGHVPNAKMPNTFMAVAMDLPDYTSPRGTIHPRFKHDVASRLALSALAVAYHKPGLEYQGPFPSSYHMAGYTLQIEYDNGRTPLAVNSNVNAFEVCCSVRNCSMNYDHWRPVPIISHDVSSVMLNTSICSRLHVGIAAVRYAWRTSPCEFKQCAIYGRDTDLPAPPFIHNFL